MAKISALTTLAANATAAGDMVPVVDASIPQTKKVLLEKFIEGAARASVAGTDLIAYNGTNITVTPTTGLLLTGTQTITSAAAAAFSVGRQGATNPAFNVKADVATNVTGLEVIARAAAAGVDLNVISSGTNENLVINAKGSGTIALNPTGTGNVITTRPVVITNASAGGLSVGRQGATTPVLNVDCSVASNVTGISIIGRAAAAGADILVTSSGTDESLVINAKGTGTITLNPTATGGVRSPRSILSTGATAGVGYATGAGGAVTQITSRTTGVTLNTVSGDITLVSAAGSPTFASFTVTNSAVGVTDTISLSQKSGTDLYLLHVTNVTAGTFRITFATTGGTTVEQPVFHFNVIKGVSA